MKRPEFGKMARRVFFATLGCVLAFNLYGIGRIASGYYQSHWNGPATTMEHARIRGVPVFHPGGSITVDFDTTRYKNCKLEVDRLIRRVDNRSVVGDQEHVIDHAVQLFKGDGVTRASWYVADLPNKLSPGKYVVFSYGIYTCNPADQIFPHTILTEEVPFEVVAESVPIPGRS